MTKTEKRKRARSIRNHLAWFVYAQDPKLRDVFTDQDMTPEYAAMNRLLMARHELNTLIEKLQAEGQR